MGHFHVLSFLSSRGSDLALIFLINFDDSEFEKHEFDLTFVFGLEDSFDSLVEGNCLAKVVNQEDSIFIIFMMLQEHLDVVCVFLVNLIHVGF